MPETTTINLQVDTVLKTKAEEVLDGLGLSINEAVTLMLQHVRHKHMLPFEPIVAACIPKPETLELIESIENGTAEMAGPFETFEEFKAWLDEDIEKKILKLTLAQTGTHSDTLD